MAELYPFENHQCSPTPIIFGLSFYKDVTPPMMARHEQVFRSMEAQGNTVIPVGWEGIKTEGEMAQRLAAVALGTLALHPYRPIKLSGHSAGALSAIRATQILIKKGQHERITELLLFSTTPGFGKNWKNFLKYHAPTDEDCRDIGLAKPGRISGNPCPKLPIPAMISYGISEGVFMREQAEAVSNNFLRSMLLPIPGGTGHRIDYPGHAAHMYTIAHEASRLSLLYPEDFDPQKARWHRQPHIGLEYTYTGFGSAVIREQDQAESKMLSLGAFSCLMNRIYEGTTPTHPEDDESAHRYAMCLQSSKKVVLDDAVRRHLSPLNFEVLYS